MNSNIVIKNLKKLILEASFNAQEGHIPSAFSILDILYVLYEDILNINSENLNDLSRDYFVLSKGHASLAHSAILYNKGLIKKTDLLSYCKFESILGGHLDRSKVPGVEISTGSLGHGISVAVGISLGCKIRKLNNKVICLCGDGEANEGTFWESLLLASNHKLSNLCILVDFNHSNDRSIKLDPLEKKIISFGFNVLSIDGHSHKQIKNTLSSLNYDRPNVIIANTIKGKGIKVMENNPEWHHKFPKQEQLEDMFKELDKK